MCIISFLKMHNYHTYNVLTVYRDLLLLTQWP